MKSRTTVVRRSINSYTLLKDQKGRKKKSGYTPFHNIKIEIIREKASRDVKITGSYDVYKTLHKKAAKLDREHFWVICLTVRNMVIGINLVSIGHVSTTTVCGRECFKPAILTGAANIILVHNHPSGCTEPSTEDKIITDRMVEAGELIGIQVLDHVILGEKDYFSFCDHEML